MLKKICFFLLGALIIMGSCSTGDSAGTQMTGGSSEALLFINCRAVSEDEVEFEFSRPVTVTSIYLEPETEIAWVENGSTVKVKLEESPPPGVAFTADILAEDADRNTVNVLVEFRSRNNRMPALVINELRTEYSKPRSEFIEFKMITAGNLGAMRIFIAGNNKPFIYEFLPVEVKAGEYVVLHLRTLEDASIDEYGEDLAESGGTDSSPDARDFWVPGAVKMLNKTGMVYVLDQDDIVLDAVMISETPDSWWKKEHLAEAADFLFQQGAWKSTDGKTCRPADAVDTSPVKTAATRSISRDETAVNSKTAADWFVTATGGATPGKPNAAKPVD